MDITDKVTLVVAFETTLILSEENICLQDEITSSFGELNLFCQNYF